MVSSIVSLTEPMATMTMLCVRCAVVVKQFVVAADSGVDLVHAALNDLRQGVVIRVAGFTGLEIDVGVLRSTAQNPDAPG